MLVFKSISLSKAKESAKKNVISINGGHFIYIFSTNLLLASCQGKVLFNICFISALFQLAKTTFNRLLVLVNSNNSVGNENV